MRKVKKSMVGLEERVIRRGENGRDGVFTSFFGYKTVF
jgi:hypothetical protein